MPSNSDEGTDHDSDDNDDERTPYDNIKARLSEQMDTHHKNLQQQRQHQDVESFNNRNNQQHNTDETATANGNNDSTDKRFNLG